jgi:hypothetical protein
MIQTEASTEVDLFVTVTLHDFSAETLKEFAKKIVKPHFGGNLNQALRSLMEKAINEETLLNHVLIADLNSSES